MGKMKKKNGANMKKKEIMIRKYRGEMREIVRRMKGHENF